MFQFAFVLAIENLRFIRILLFVYSVEKTISFSSPWFIRLMSTSNSCDSLSLIKRAGLKWVLDWNIVDVDFSNQKNSSEPADSRYRKIATKIMVMLSNGITTAIRNSQIEANSFPKFGVKALSIMHMKIYVFTILERWTQIPMLLFVENLYSQFFLYMWKSIAAQYSNNLPGEGIHLDFHWYEKERHLITIYSFIKSF